MPHRLQHQQSLLPPSPAPLPGPMWTTHTSNSGTALLPEPKLEAVVLERSEKAGPEGLAAHGFYPAGSRAQAGWCLGVTPQAQEVPGRCCCWQDQMKETGTEDWMVTAKPTNAREENKGTPGSGAGRQSPGVEARGACWEVAENTQENSEGQSGWTTEAGVRPGGPAGPGPG